MVGGGEFGNQGHITHIWGTLELHTYSSSSSSSRDGRGNARVQLLVSLDIA
jgi:hypothetical protein